VFRKTISEVREDVDRHAEDLRGDLDRVGTLLTVTLIAVGALAAFALMYAAANRRADG
jgi:hypothetical protein